MKFEKEYYTTNNYKDYLLRKGRYQKLAKEIDEFLYTLGFNFRNKSVLDYGCAVGFLMEGLKEIGYKKIKGIEISEWAKSIVKSKKLTILNSNKIPHQDLVFFLDVLEHIQESEVNKILKNINTDFILVRIPVCKKDNGNFYLEISEKDSTHINRKTKKTWVNVFNSNGFDLVSFINLNIIYNSEGVFCALFKNKKISLLDIV
jgi:SAM-dependent methyltransferase